MKKNISLILAVLMLTSLLAGCGAAHTHTAGAVWEWSGTEHWHLCECGEKVGVKPHHVGDDMICADCGVNVWDLGEGYIDGTSYNEYGMPLRMASFDPDGNVLSENRWEYAYDDEGNILKENFYVDGFLQDENEYVTTADGVNYLKSSINHQEDGWAHLNEYDEMGNVVKLVSYDPDGKVDMEGFYEYACDENGEFYEVKTTEIQADGTTYVAEHNVYGDTVHWCAYLPDGTVEYERTYEYEYNEDGKPLWIKEYENGVLTYEILGYAEITDEDGYTRYPETAVEYFADGTKLVSEYGENTEVAVETGYNADGSVDYVYTYTYEINDLDGQTVTVTDQSGEIVEQIVYNADGDVVE